MFYHHLRNELWKLFGKKRTYIGFGAFLLAQNAMLLTFRFTHWQQNMEGVLAGNGYTAQQYVSALTVALIMLLPQTILLMPLYASLVGGDLVAKEVEDGTLRMILSRPISRVRLLWVKWLAGIACAGVLVLMLGSERHRNVHCLFTERARPLWGSYPPAIVWSQSPRNPDLNHFDGGPNVYR